MNQSIMYTKMANKIYNNLIFIKIYGGLKKGFDYNNYVMEFLPDYIKIINKDIDKITKVDMEIFKIYLASTKNLVNELDVLKMQNKSRR